MDDPGSSSVYEFLTWKQVTDEIRPSSVPARPGEHPMSTSAIASMRRNRSANSAIVLQVLLWLGRSPESFLVGNATSARTDELLPLREPGHFCALIRARSARL